jgi:cytohesin
MANAERAEELIRDGEDKDAATDRGETPLIIAAGAGAVDIVTLLIDEGASTEATDQEDRTVLHAAIMGKNLELVMYLVNTKSIPATFDPSEQYPPLFAAVESGDIEIVKLLVSKGAKATTADQNGTTVLHRAVALNHLDIATFLISKGAKATTKNGDDQTALHIIAKDCPPAADCMDMAKFLVKKGAKKNAKDADGLTPADYASDRGDEEMAKFFGAK